MSDPNPPSIGELMHRFVLEAPVRTSDGAGGAQIAYALAAEVWGSLRGLNGSEPVHDDRVSGRVTHGVWLRYRDGLTPDHRLRLGTRVFQIHAIIDRTGRRRYLECQCEEIVT